MFWLHLTENNISGYILFQLIIALQNEERKNKMEANPNKQICL